MNYLLLASVRPPFLEDAQLDKDRLDRTAQGVFPDAFGNISETFPVTAAVLICAGLLLLLTAAWGWQRYKQRHLRSEPMLTFHQMATAMGLSLKQQWLLVRIARRQMLPTPLTLMLSSATLGHHAQQFADLTPPRHREAINNDVNAITRLLFEDAASIAPPG